MVHLGCAAAFPPLNPPIFPVWYNQSGLTCSYDKDNQQNMPFIMGFLAQHPHNSGYVQSSWPHVSEVLCPIQPLI